MLHDLKYLHSSWLVNVTRLKMVCNRISLVPSMSTTTKTNNIKMFCLVQCVFNQYC